MSCLNLKPNSIRTKPFAMFTTLQGIQINLFKAPTMFQAMSKLKWYQFSTKPRSSNLNHAQIQNKSQIDASDNFYMKGQCHTRKQLEEIQKKLKKSSQKLQLIRKVHVHLSTTVSNGLQLLTIGTISPWHQGDPNYAFLLPCRDRSTAGDETLAVAETLEFISS